MATRPYTASKTRDQGRDRYSVIFRHPARLDPSTGKPGRRVRRGLGTADEVEADRLVSQINELLSNQDYWSLTARPVAAARFDPRAVSVFFDGMDPKSLSSSSSLRDRFIPLPSSDDGYRRVLLLGTTGAGKTTVVRQLLGTHPERDRFPSTSTAKTTIADTEIITTDDDTFRAVVTFVPRDEVVDHLVDCASKAALSCLRGASDDDVRRLLLDHENQRFRFSYVLGRRRAESKNAAEESNRVFEDFDEGNDEEENSVRFEAEPSDLTGIDLDVTAAVVDNAVETLRKVVTAHAADTSAQLGVDTHEDERVAQEILEEELDKILRRDELFNAAVDSLIDEIEKRFDALSQGSVARDTQGWPSTWTWETTDRVQFLTAVNRFSSNYAPLFGHLLSPLVDGIRVAGPFAPRWLKGEAPKLVLIDGEGLGHTPKSSSVLPTTVARTIEEVDAVLLVDNATQPVQAAPTTAIRSMLTAGNIDKLLICFTHFDEVKGDNLRNANDRARHVIASVENLAAAIRDEFGPRSERALRRRLESYRFFLANIDKELEPTNTESRRSIGQFEKMLEAIDTITERPDTGPARPVYDKMNLVLAITAALKSFHRRWNAILGLTYEPDAEKEHWTRVKALNRRFAEGTADQYDTLRPASELRELLKDEIYKTLETPLQWDGTPPTDDEAVTAVINEFSQAIAKRLFTPVKERLSIRPQRSWQDTYSLSGHGSTFLRARRISEEILMTNVPIPGATPSPDQNKFLHEVIATIEEAAEHVGVKLT